MKILIFLEAALFIVAALVHSGKMVSGFKHNKARIAEGVIAIVLLSGFVLGFVSPAWLNAAGLTVQAFALLGTLVGLFTMLIGVGPRSVPDYVFHIMIIILLGFGLIITGKPDPATLNAEGIILQKSLLYLHSALRYLLIVLLAWSLYTAVLGLTKRKEYTTCVSRIHLSTRILLNVQMIIGLILYFAIGYFHLLDKLGNISGKARFFTIVHITGMIIGISLVNVGYHLAAKSESDERKYQRITVFYGIGFLVIFMMIPWPFFHSWAAWF
ncbi:MAG TPA: hypothetical protein VKA08_04000 [Balneolales bacterium]|nr:hypothetical protein [Balneolales bacterium]